MLIVGTMVVIRQLDYLQAKSWGIKKKNTVILPLDHQTEKVFPALKSELLRSGAVASVARATESPIAIKGGYSINLQQGSTNAQGMIVTAMAIDEEFIPHPSASALIAGRNFTEADMQKTKADTTGNSFTFIVNESTLHELSLDIEKAVGTKVGLNGRNGEIIGVAKDFHFAPLHQKISPLVLFTEDNQYSYIFAKLKGTDTPAALAQMKKSAKPSPHTVPLNILSSTRTTPPSIKTNNACAH